MYPDRAVLMCTRLEGMTDLRRERKFAGASLFGRRPISRTEIFLQRRTGSHFRNWPTFNERCIPDCEKLDSALIAPSRCSALIILAVARKTHTHTDRHTHARAHTLTHTYTRFIYDAQQSITNEHSTPGSN